MRKIIMILFVVALHLPVLSCRDTVPPETLEDEETSKEGSSDEGSSEEVDLGKYDDESGD